MRLLFFTICSIVLYSCSENKSTTPVISNEESVAPAKPDTMRTVISLSGPKDTVVNGEEIKHHSNGKVSMRGIRKNNEREGVWKSWYDTGIQWSETTFKQGKKDGKTTTWYENGNKRYEGFYKDDAESGKWTFWYVNGNVIKTIDYDKK